MTEHVVVTASDGICEVRLNRPEKRNALTLAMYEALTGALQSAEADDAIRVVLISGAGAGFTGGNDLNDFLSGVAANEQESAPRFMRALPQFSKVLIAAIHGTTVGIGVTMLLHCDLVFAARSARLSMPFVQLGLVPEAASSLLLPRLVGPQRAAELLLFGAAIDAETARAYGLVNRVTSDETLLDEARAAARVAASQPLGALRATKKLLRADTDQVLQRMEAELAAFRERLSSAEFRAAAQAFFSKGRPAR